MKEHLAHRPLFIVLIKPSKYDDDGYVVHHLRGVLPSNTLYVLNALFQGASHNKGIEAEIHLIDETVQLVNPRKIARLASKRGAMLLVGLVGVQTNQFVRAGDLARQFRKLGAMVIMGGFHVSGSISTLGMTPELRELIDCGVSLFVGEAEGRLEEVLADAHQGTLQSLYRPSGFPDLSRQWPLPTVAPEISKRFALPHAGTIDTSRGCVFRCSFCTVIQVQGTRMRSRRPSDIEAHIRRHYPSIRYYFFTDDNMARNRGWPDIFQRLIEMRREGIRIKFMMQVDTASHRLPNFCDQAARAGCSQVFIGIESLNPENLHETGKVQNKVERFEEMVGAWHEAGVAVHGAYIVGFPHDTPGSVAAQVDSLATVVRPDQASIFMLTPLPGSLDHKELSMKGERLDPDFNKYDSFHAITAHRHMSESEWRKTYAQAWSTMYSFPRLRTMLRNLPSHLYWDIFKNTAWYRYALRCEKQHPMITGFWRLKGRTQRRASLAREGVLRYWHRRTADCCTLLARLLRLVLELEQLWWNTWLDSRGKLQLPSIRELRWRKGDGGLARFPLMVRRLTRTAMKLKQRYEFLRLHSSSRHARRFGLPNRYIWRAQRVTLGGVTALTRVWLFLLNFAVEA